MTVVNDLGIVSRLIQKAGRGDEFQVVVLKKGDGRVRRMRGVHTKFAPSKPKGKGGYIPEEHNLLRIWEVNEKGYRSVNLEQVVGFRFGKEPIVLNDRMPLLHKAVRRLL